MDQAVNPAEWGAKPADAPVESGVDPASWGAKPVAADTSEPFAVTAKREAEAITAGQKATLSRMWEQSLPNTLLKLRATEEKEQEALRLMTRKDELTGTSAFEQEVERRKKAGEPYDQGRMAAWVQGKAKEIVHGPRPADVPIGEQLTKIKDFAVEHPFEFAKGFLEGMAAHPEYMFSAALVTAPLQSMWEQQADTGYVDLGKVLLDTGLTAGPYAVLHGATALGQDLGKGAKATKAAHDEAMTKVIADIKDGKAPDAALKNVMDSFGTPPEEAAHIAEQAKEVINAERDTSRPVLPEAQGKEGQVQRGGDLPVLDQAKPALGQEPQARQEAGPGVEGLADDLRKVARGESVAAKPVEPAPVAEEPRAVAPEAKVNQFKPMPEGVPAWLTPADVSALYNMAGFEGDVGKVNVASSALRHRLTKFMGGQTYADNLFKEALETGKIGKVMEVQQKLGKQAGQIDPKLMMYLAAGGAGVASAVWLSRDRTMDIKTLMAIGAIPLALTLAGKTTRAVGAMWNKSQLGERLHPVEPFREFNANPQIMGTAIDIWAKQTDALLTEPWKGVLEHINPAERFRRAQRKESSQLKVWDYIQGHRDMGPLTKPEAAYAENIQKFLEYIGKYAHDADVIEHLRKDFFPGIYKKPAFQTFGDIIKEAASNDLFRGSYPGMSRNSRHNLQKVFPDRRAAEQARAEGKFSLEPLSNDPVKIASLYANSVAKTVAVNKLISDLRATPTGRTYQGTGIPIPVIVAADAPSSAVKVAKSYAKMGEHLDLPPEARAMQAKEAVADAHSDFVFVNHPSLNGLKVHRDVAPMMKMVFDTSDPNIITNGLYAATIAAKSLFFTFSLFHPTALLTTAATLAIPRIGSMTNYWRASKTASAMRRDSAYAPLVKEAAQAGVTWHTKPQDVDPNLVSRILDFGVNTMNKVGVDTSIGRVGAGMPIQALRFVNNNVQHMIWNWFYPTLKLASFTAEMERWAKVSSGVTQAQPMSDKLGKWFKGGEYPKDRATAAHQIAQGVNDMFGGINWFNLANDAPEHITQRLGQAIFSPEGRRVQQLLFLAPDWNIAAGRAWYEGIKAVMPGVTRRASDSMYRNYLLYSAATYIGGASALSMMFTGKPIWEQKDWTYVDVGDGTKVQLNKHFMEMVHLTADPQKFFVNKMAVLPREVLNQWFGKDWVYWDQKKGAFSGPPMKELPLGLTRPVHAAEAFIPLTIANTIRDPASGLMGMIGIPRYGTTYEQREQEAGARAEEKGKSAEAAKERYRKRRKRQQEQEERASQ